MNAKLSGLIDSFASLNVLVVGDVMLDCYLEGTTNRLCREAPVPVVEVGKRRCYAGGAANAAVNVAMLGGQTSILSVCGSDSAGEQLSEAFAQNNVSVEHLFKHPTRQTLTKKRIVSGGQMLVRFDEGDGEPLDELTEARFIERLSAAFVAADAVLLSDYGYGIFTGRVIQKIAELQRKHPRLIVADSRQLGKFRKVGVTAIKPNFAETMELLGSLELDAQLPRAEQIERHAEKLLRLTNARVAAVTLDTEGAIIVETNRPAHRTYTPPRTFANATGAGDTFAGTLTLALAAGAHTPAAAELASAAASLVVEKERTAVCTADELHEYVVDAGKNISDLSRLVAKVEAEREKGRKLVFTNGCFDILHRGHITYLNQAKSLGDVLIVGVNSDQSVGRLKPGRPINPLDDRLQVLAALSCIDYLIAFDENSPAAIIEAVKPDVYAKGGDYTLETLPETPIVQAVGGRVEFLPYLEDHSTTGIIERIREAYAIAS